MAVKLKKLLGEAGAGMDESNGQDRLYDVLKALVTQANDQAAQFNTLKAEYDAETLADHTDSAATDVVAGVEIE